ncbi:MAG: LPS-assembly protein LptD [Deltaproteobacteria bacterium]|nr:LPS-assembly protein LptD [Deltaproteobacteria bacterium]
MSFERTQAVSIMLRRTSLILSIAFLIIPRANFSFAADGLLKDYILGDKKARWEITADRLSYMENESLYVAEGDVVIKKGGQIFSAQKAIYNKQTGIVQVSGGIRLEVDGDTVTGETGLFDLNNNIGQITKGHLFSQENHYHIRGNVIQRLNLNTYIVKGCRLTTCDGIKPDWSITGSEVKVTIGGYGTVKHATFRIRDFPVFYIPYAVFPVKTARQTGLLPPRLGYSSRNGVDVEVPFFWAISDQTDATFYEHFMSKRGFMQGFEFRYLAEMESKGVFLFDILSDRIEKKDFNNSEEVDLSPFPRTNSTRYWLRSRTDQQLPGGIKARLDTDFVSDQDYLKEFRGGLYGFETRPDLAKESGRPVEEIYSPTRRSALRLSHERQDYSLQALASYHQRPENPANDETPQPLAGLDFALLPRPLAGLPLFVKFDTDYDHIWRDEGLKGNSVSFTPELSYPMWLGPYLEFEPSVSFTRDTQWIDNDHEDIDEQSRDVYQMQAKLSTALERSFDIEHGDVKRLKHKVLPSLTYNFRVHKDEDRDSPWFEQIDAEGKVNQVTLSIENFLDARKEDDKGEVTYAQWCSFSLSQGYDIDEARGDEEPSRKKETFEPLVGILTFMPFFYDLHLYTEARWDHYDNNCSFADLSLELTVDRSGGREDSYEIDYQYTKGENDSINYRLNINLLYGFSAGTSLKRDLDLRHSIESSYWLDYQSQCWGLRIITENLDGMDSIMVTFRLLGLGDNLGK